MAEPTPRPKVFDAYWHFAAERQRMFYRRLRGDQAPWTEDDILDKHRFCNAFRASDRVSQYLIKHVIYGEHLSQDPDDIMFRMLLFRFFNSISTWELLEKLYGDPRLEIFDVDKWYKDMDTGQGLFNGAFMTCGIKTHGYDKKHGNYLGLVGDMVKNGVINAVRRAKTLESIYWTLNGYKLVGKFLSYQIATDINYSNVVCLDNNQFTMAGPGAERGIKKVFFDTGGMTPAQIIQWMRKRQREEFEKRGVEVDVSTIWGHELQAIDIQNLFCETDKYSRAKFPDLGEGPKRIKQTFKRDLKPVPRPFYPPKWGINDKVGELPDVPKIANPDDDLPWSVEW
jgi:hypothetical protein